MNTTTPHKLAEIPMSRIESYIAGASFDRPTLILDTEVVIRNYNALKLGLGHADIHYAVKANPTPEIIATLAGAGSNFDAASRGEIELCLGLG